VPTDVVFQLQLQAHTAELVTLYDILLTYQVKLVQMYRVGVYTTVFKIELAGYP